jgi:hypothetical protein
MGAQEKLLCLINASEIARCLINKEFDSEELLTPLWR